jgi:para-nitrobenzyl esterase
MPLRILRGTRAAAACTAFLCVGCLLLHACSDDAGAPDTQGTSKDDDSAEAAAHSTGSSSPGAMGVTTGASARSGLLISLTDGQIQGDMAGGARRFLNIPYAKPPLGELRWKAAVPNEPWSGVRHESEFIKGCAQLADQGAPASDNEDCLYLNVWSPEPAPERAPVMVWIHGGGNFSGGTGIPIPNTQELWYDGRVFAERQKVVLVTIQYRLGPFGFFAHPGLSAENEPVGNQGLLDQRLALKWVQKNIAKFGGDPDNVTIFGESAGSADVCYHVASPGSRGLFHRAISESGGCTMRTIGAEKTLTETAASMEAYGKAAGCEPGPEQLACLRKLPVETLLANSMQPMPGAGGTLTGNAWSFAAVRGGAQGFLPEDTLQALFDRGEIAKVPYLLGSNHDEGTTFVVRAPPLASESDYMADLQMRFGADAPRVAAVYPPAKFDNDYNAARARVIGDSVVCSTHDTAIRAAKAGLRVFMYDFNVAWSLSPALLKAGHAAEISHVFGTPYLPAPDPDSEAVAAAMNTYWANFARSGDPNGSGQPATWPEFEPDADKRLQLDPGWAVLENFRSEECAFWRQYYSQE